MLYTIVPIEYIFGGEEPPDDTPPKKDDDGEVIIKKRGISLMVEPYLPGQYRVNRIISTNPQDYLKPEWQPGMIIS